MNSPNLPNISNISNIPKMSTCMSMTKMSESTIKPRPTLENRADLKEYLSNTLYETTIIKLTASWCGPCKKIAPYVNQMNQEYSKNHSFEYIELDVDECLDLYAFFKKMKMANGVPTFLCFKKRLFDPDHYYVPYQCITGADPRGLHNFYQASFS